MKQPRCLKTLSVYPWVCGLDAGHKTRCRAGPRNTGVPASEDELDDPSEEVLREIETAC